jgi:pyruvate,water dikinase
VRAAARVCGEHLARAGSIDDPEDVFFLTLEEIGDHSDLRAVVSERKRLRAEYERMDIPMTGSGTPEPAVSSDSTATRDGPLDTGATLKGLGASHGVVEGRVHVAVDPRDISSFEPGEVLVCRTTDPSWTTWFMMSSAVVIDIGGTLSHGAIVARELAIPCVINTKIGTHVLQTGDRVRVDGDIGAVTILERVGRAGPR